MTDKDKPVIVNPLNWSKEFTAGPSEWIFGVRIPEGYKYRFCETRDAGYISVPKNPINGRTLIRV